MSGSGPSAGAAEAVSAVAPGILAAIGSAVRARLELGFPPSRFEHQFMPAKISQAEWKSLMRRTPFVGLGWNALDPTRDVGRLFTGESHWSLFLATRNSASIRGRYFGDAQGPGLFPLVTAAVAMLHGWTIPEIGSVAVTKAANVYAEGWEDESAIAAVDFCVATVIPVAGAVTAPWDLGTFEELGITWNWDGADRIEGDLVEIGA